MATVAGGIFDTSVNTSIDDTIADGISNFLTSIGLEETSLNSEVIVGTGGTLNTYAGNDNTPIVFDDETISGGTINQIITGDGGSNTISGAITSGDFQLTVGLPPQAGLAIKGLNFVANGNDVANYLKSLVSAVIPASTTVDNSAAAQVKDNIEKAISSVVKTTDTNTVVRVVEVLSDKFDTTSAPKEVKVSVSANPTDNEVVAVVNANKIRTGDTLVVENIEKVVVVGSGKIKVSETQTAAVTISGDNRDQEIAGGAGNDTLFGGGGNDTLSGGAGDDTFVVGTGGGNTTIASLDSGDKIGFNIPGVTNFEELKAAISSVEIDGDNLVATFNNGTKVTLVGVAPENISADLFLFDV